MTSGTYELEGHTNGGVRKQLARSWTYIRREKSGRETRIDQQDKLKNRVREKRGKPAEGEEKKKVRGTIKANIRIHWPRGRSGSG